MKNSVKKTAVFGGSFDPPHFGHIDIVKNLEKKFDSVIVMPSFVSPFKSDADDAALRYKLCKCVFSSDKTAVSRYEINKKGISYSVDTAAYLMKKTDGDLYWVVGSEELGRLCEWRDIDRLKTYVTFYVVERPGYPVSSETLRVLKKHKIKIKTAPFKGSDISSVRIKIDRAFGRPNSFMPYCVYDVAEKHGAFDPYGKYTAALKKYGLSYSRIAHTYGTAVRGAELAKLYGASVHDAVVACILHDIAKNADIGEYADKVDIKGFPEPTAHSPIGAYIAKKEFGVSDEIADAIAFHSTAKPGMSLLGEIVYLADKTESGRRYPSLEHKRYLCGVNKNIAMLSALTEISELNAEEDCRLTRDAIEYYKELCCGAAIPDLPDKAETRQYNLPAVGRNVSRSIRVVPQAKSKAIATAADKSVACRRKFGTDLSVAVRADNGKGFVSTGNDIKDIAVAAADALDAHKAHDIDIVDIDGKTIIADYFVIASATSTTAVKALMGYVEDRLKKQFDIDPGKRDINTEWIALDYGNVIVHIFTDKTREFYNIERLWADGGNVERYGDR